MKHEEENFSNQPATKILKIVLVKFGNEQEIFYFTM